ncbi:MAG: DUF6293 family protein [Thaumarchaeota archaeon]|nr:DUF6293 family protein [Nitrososphaerota archaeon]
MKDLRIHIVPIGLDPQERITVPLINLKADRAYLVSHLNDSQTAEENLKLVRRVLERKLPSCELKAVATDIWDMFGCLEQYRKIFREEAENRIYVNTSTGSKIACITGMLACMMWGGTPYYAKLDYSKEKPAKIRPMEVEDTIELPRYELNMPDERSLTVLSIIRKAGGRMTKKDLIEKLKELNIIPPFLPHQRSAPHSRLRPILDPLRLNWKFVETMARGRKSDIILTKQGETALRIFGER